MSHIFHGDTYTETHPLFIENSGFAGLPLAGFNLLYLVPLPEGVRVVVCNSLEGGEYSPENREELYGESDLGEELVWRRGRTAPSGSSSQPCGPPGR